MQLLDNHCAYDYGGSSRFSGVMPTFNELWISHKIVGRAWAAAAAAHCTTLCELVFIIARLDIANPDGLRTHTDGLLLFKQYCRDSGPYHLFKILLHLITSQCKCVQLIKAHFVAKWKMLFGLDSLFNGIFLINHPHFKKIPIFLPLAISKLPPPNNML